MKKPLQGCKKGVIVPLRSGGDPLSCDPHSLGFKSAFYVSLGMYVTHCKIGKGVLLMMWLFVPKLVQTFFQYFLINQDQ